MNLLEQAFTRGKDAANYDVKYQPGCYKTKYPKKRNYNVRNNIKVGNNFYAFLDYAGVPS